MAGYFGINEGKLCITLLSGPITSPEQKTLSKVALSLSAFPLVLSAEIEFSQLYSSGRLTMFVPSTILIQFWQTKDPVANNDLVENGFWKIAETWRKGGNLVTDAQIVWWKVLEVRKRIKRHFLIASTWIAVGDKLHRKGFKACLYSSWNLAAADCTTLKHNGLRGSYGETLSTRMQKGTLCIKTQPHWDSIYITSSGFSNVT